MLKVEMGYGHGGLEEEGDSLAHLVPAEEVKDIIAGNIDTHEHIVTDSDGSRWRRHAKRIVPRSLNGRRELNRRIVNFYLRKINKRDGIIGTVVPILVTVHHMNVRAYLSLGEIPLEGDGVITSYPDKP